MFGRRASLKQLSILCRSLSTMLHSGVSVVKAFALAAEKTPDPKLRSTLLDVVDQLKSGEAVGAALRAHDGYFPDLVLDMVEVAEQTGTLPEVLRALADHFESNLRLRRDFLAQITFPAIQFTAAILIVAALIFLLGIIAGSGAPMDVLGFGLFGASGALKWLTGWALLIASAFIVYKLTVSSLQGQRILHTFLLNVPAIGGCLRSFAIARFSWAYYLTQQAGMPITDSLDASLRATANGAFVTVIPQITGDVMEGETLTDALAATGLFPKDYIQIVHVAETSGTVPEALERLSPQFEDQARRSLRALAALAGWGVWACVAAFVIFLIFRVAMWYVGLINEAANEALGI